MAAKKSARKTAKKTPSHLIQCYGLFWTEEDVFWGDKGDKGALLGKPAKRKKAKPVDFRYQAGIYVLYDDFKALYVGQAGTGEGRLFDRLREHLTDHLAQRWNRFSWFGLRRVNRSGKLGKLTGQRHPAISDVLNHMEAILIASSEPTLNRQGARWGKAEQYLQVRDPILADMESDIVSIYDWVEEQKADAARVAAKAKKKAAQKR